MYRSYSVNNMPEPVRYNSMSAPKREEKVAKTEKSRDVKKEETPASNCEKPAFGIQTDDIILGVVILALLMDGCDDKVLLAVLALVLFADYFDF